MLSKAWSNKKDVTHARGYTVLTCIRVQNLMGAQWLSGSVVKCLTIDQRASGSSLTSCHCVVSLSKNINSSLVLVQPRKTRPYITERLLMGRKESNQSNKQNLIKHTMWFKSYEHFHKLLKDGQM